MSRISVAPDQTVSVSATPSDRRRIVSDTAPVSVSGVDVDVVLQPGDDVVVGENVTIKAVDPVKTYIQVSTDNTLPVVDGTAESLTEALVSLGIVRLA